jgi:hypothetical protein
VRPHSWSAGSEYTIIPLVASRAAIHSLMRVLTVSGASWCGLAGTTHGTHPHGELTNVVYGPQPLSCHHMTGCGM